MNPQEKKEFEELKAWKRSLEASHSIPLNIDQAFRARLLTNASLIPSSKGATTENQPVNEAGASSYSVLKAPDGFLQITLGLTIYYIPIYT